MSDFAADGRPVTGRDMDNDLTDRLARHPAPLAAVDALIHDERGRVLLVDPVYKEGWDLPGGMLEDEEIVEGLRREVLEELGLHITVGRLLCVDNLPRRAHGRSLIAFVYAARTREPVTAAEWVLREDELRDAAFFPPQEALELLPPGLRRRVRAALDAERGAHTAHLLDGRSPVAEPPDHYATLPAPMAAATALITDEQGRVLVLKTSYKENLELPGGMVLADESPQQGAAREISEELGLDDVPVGRLLAVDSAPAGRRARALDVHVFSVGPLTSEQIQGIHFPDGEIVAAHWMPPKEAVDCLPERLGLRVVAALGALATGSIAQLTEGVPQIGSPAGVTAARRSELERQRVLSPADYLAVRPKALAAACVLFTDADGRVLVVQPTYLRGDGWLLPGGAVDSDLAETPRQAARREVREELGLEAEPVGRLLAVDWLTGPPHLAEVVHVYDGGTLSAEQIAAIRLPPHELAQWRLVEPQGLEGLLYERLVPRVLSCLDVRAAGAGAVELHNGWPVN
ncbi:NUDIX domain-containing protein [Wenjunlia tyrosinilytica]|uniref:Nudix hydrolase domain-containing protein n=1 Tax=Wenjunlia tyrosinilytica TaxID=1544741 RepID=A0A918DXV5_9ACTN|nr:NUDIX domain-containing protein [Wenjunlia tyrosinilytica]GGO90087.1 hypothetical protein GCM10012280_34800 [Wenjunlia tyrosinilytica]